MTVQGKVEAIRTDSGQTYLFPRIAVDVAGGNRVYRAQEAIVDTGFTGWLTLPASTISELGLTHRGQRPATLASGEAEIFHVYGTLVSWHGQLRPVPVLSADTSPLIGMALLQGSRLAVDALEGGDVIIEEL